MYAATSVIKSVTAWSVHLPARGHVRCQSEKQRTRTLCGKRSHLNSVAMVSQPVPPSQCSPLELIEAYSPRARPRPLSLRASRAPLFFLTRSFNAIGAHLSMTRVKRERERERRSIGSRPLL